MTTKKVKKAIFKLAEMCNTTKCADCYLSFGANKCILKHADLQDIAKGCFDCERHYEGTVWIRFDSKEAYEATGCNIMEHLDPRGDYMVNVYLKDTNLKSAIAGMKADDEALETLTQIYGEENVKLIMKVPEDVKAYF